MKKSNALSLKDAAAITKPVKVFYDPPGFDMYWSPGKQLTDSEKKAMQERFIKSATFIEIK